MPHIRLEQLTSQRSIKKKMIDNLSADYLQRQSALSVWVHCSLIGPDKATAVLKHHATKAAGNRGTAPLTLKFGVILRSMFKFTVRPLYPIHNRHNTQQIKGFVQSSVGLDAMEKSYIFCRCLEPNPRLLDRPAHNVVTTRTGISRLCREECKIHPLYNTLLNRPKYGTFIYTQLYWSY
jgi:hypothetical protein